MKAEFKFGTAAALILSVFLIVGGLINNDLANAENPFQRGGFGGFFWWFVRTLIVLGAMLLAANSLKKDSQGYLKFGQTFANSYKTGWIVIIVYTLISVAYYNVLNPNWLNLSYSDYEDFMEQAMDESNVDLDEVMPIFKFVFDHINAILAIVYIFTNAFAFAILALISATIMSKDNPNEINL